MNILNNIHFLLGGCGDPILALILKILHTFNNIILIAVPIAMILGLTIRFALMTFSPDDDQKVHFPAVKTIILSGVIIFMLPAIVNLTFYIINTALPDNDFEIAQCWKEAEKTDIKTNIQQ